MHHAACCDLPLIICVMHMMNTSDAVLYSHVSRNLIHEHELRTLRPRCSNPVRFLIIRLQAA